MDSGPGPGLRLRLGLVYLSVSLVLLSPPVRSAVQAEQYSRGVDWLSRYGYLPPPDPRAGKLQTKEGIERAIRQMQRFAGLKETGQLDTDTVRLMSTPRCSLPDIVGAEDMLRRRRRRRYALSGLYWKNTSLTWSVLSFPTLQPVLDPRVVEELLHQAFKVWSQNTNIHFQNLPRSQASQADIKISFSRSFHDDGYPFDGKGGTLAHAFFPGEVDIAGDTHFDDDESWTFRAPDSEGTDLFTVAVHEFGHALGLSHSSSHPSIMQPYYQGSAGDFTTYTLPEDDRRAIQTLYGIKSKTSTAPPAGRPTPRRPDLPRTPPPRVTLKPDSGHQDRCSGGFDAVANIRGEVFFFRGQYFWRMQRSGSLVSLNPARITNFWMGLPADTDKIDAVYERKTDNNIIFFIGSQFWMFKDTVALPGYPRPVSEWGMRRVRGRQVEQVEQVEAAFVWAHNGKTYLFSGGEFWRFTDVQGNKVPQPDPEYPRNSTLWRSVPSHPDDIITWGQGDTYFFKDDSYWVLKSGGMEQEVITPGSTSVDWMLCPAASPTVQPRSRKEECSCGFSRASTSTPPALILILILVLIHLH